MTIRGPSRMLLPLTKADCALRRHDIFKSLGKAFRYNLTNTPNKVYRMEIRDVNRVITIRNQCDKGCIATRIQDKVPCKLTNNHENVFTNLVSTPFYEGKCEPIEPVKTTFSAI